MPALLCSHGSCCPGPSTGTLLPVPQLWQPTQLLQTLSPSMRIACLACHMDGSAMAVVLLQLKPCHSTLNWDMTDTDICMHITAKHA